MVGSHTDSVAAGPGINDNGSGTISILTIAKQLARFQVKNAVRFGFWTAEEFGLLGSKFYVANLSEAERNRIRMVSVAVCNRLSELRLTFGHANSTATSTWSRRPTTCEYPMTRGRRAHLGG